MGKAIVKCTIATYSIDEYVVEVPCDKDEVDEIIRWLTGYDQARLQEQIERGSDFRTFFDHAPALHPNASLIKGVVCGVRVEAVEDPLMQKIRWLDKLVDELAKGKAMAKILRQ